MWCPKCGCEYREGFDSCSDCHVSLLKEKPKPEVAETQTREDAPTALVASYSSRQEAMFVQGMLAGSGIQSWIKADDCGGMRPEIAFGMGGVEVYVSQSDLERSQQLISEYQQSRTQSASKQPQDEEPAAKRDVTGWKFVAWCLVLPALIGLMVLAFAVISGLLKS